MEEESYTPIRSEKKKKRNPEPEMEMVEEEEDTVIRSEKKKKKDRTLVAEMVDDDDDDEEFGSEEKKKKKKKKSKERNPVEEMDDDDIIRSEEKKKKKKKKRKERNTVEEMVEVDDDDTIRSEKKKKKKKKREKIDVKMEIVTEHKDLTAPVVGYFPSGFDFQKASHQPDVKVYRHTQRSNRLQLVVSPRNSNIDFVGTSYAGEASSSQVCTYALGVLDKETQCLKIVPIACNKIFRLEPRVAGSESYEKALVVKEEPLTRAEKAERIKILTIGLGTKGSRKKAEKEEKMKLKESASVQEDMEKKIKNVVVNKEALETTAVFAVRNIPPHDSTATTPEDAYPLDKIIVQSEWHYLRDVLQCVQSENELPSNAYASFVRNRAQKLLDIKDEMERDTLAGIFSFINHLIKFKDQQSFDTKESVKSHRVPEILFQKFKSMFTDPGSKPSNEKKDLLVSYVLVLTLYADDFKTDPSDIAKDLRLTKISLRPYFLNLGCKLSKVDKQDVMTLPVPLDFPKPNERRRKR